MEPDLPPEILARLLARADALGIDLGGFGLASPSPVARGPQAELRPGRLESRYEDPIEDVRTLRRGIGTLVDFLPGWGDLKAVAMDAPAALARGDGLGGGIAALTATIPFWGRLKHLDEALDATRPFHPGAVQRDLLSTGGSTSGNRLVFMPPRDFLTRAHDFGYRGSPSPDKLQNLAENADWDADISEIPFLRIRPSQTEDKLEFLTRNGVITPRESEIIRNTVKHLGQDALPDEIGDLLYRSDWPDLVHGHEGRHRNFTAYLRDQPLMPTVVRYPYADFTREAQPFVVREVGYGTTPVILDAPTDPSRAVEQSQVAREVMARMGDDARHPLSFEELRDREWERLGALAARGSDPRRANYEGIIPPEPTPSREAAALQESILSTPDIVRERTGMTFLELLGRTEPTPAPPARRPSREAVDALVDDLMAFLKRPDSDPRRW